MELCENGSLDNFLVKMEQAAVVSEGLSHSETLQLYSWTEQVAMGMEFLAKQNV